MRGAIMKRLAAIILISASVTACCLFLFPAGKVSAQEVTYGAVGTDSAYLYTQENLAESSKKFIIPKTYYVRILEDLGSCYYVSYMDGESNYYPITGYMKNSDLLSAVPEKTPYGYVKKLAKKSIPTLYTAPDTASKVITAVLTDDVYFYGIYATAQNTSWYFIKADKSFGYAKASEFEEFEITKHPDYKEPVVPPDTENGDNTNPDKNKDPEIVQNASDSALQIILIALICIPAVIVVFLLLSGNRNRKKRKKGDYPPYDQDHYYDE